MFRICILSGCFPQILVLECCIMYRGPHLNAKPSSSLKQRRNFLFVFVARFSKNDHQIPTSRNILSILKKQSKEHLCFVSVSNVDFFLATNCHSSVAGCLLQSRIITEEDLLLATVIRCTKK